MPEQEAVIATATAGKISSPYLRPSRVVQWLSLAVLLTVLCLALVIAVDAAYFEPHSNSEWLTPLSSGTIAVNGQATDQVSALWYTDAHGSGQSAKRTYYFQLAHHNSTYVLRDSATHPPLLRLYETVTIGYQAGQGDLETVTSLLVVSQ